MNETNIRELMKKVAVAAKSQGIAYAIVTLGEKGPIVGTNMQPEDAAFILAEVAGSIIVGTATSERCCVDADDAFDQAPPSLS